MTETPQIDHIERTKVRPSPLQYRKRKPADYEAKLQELAESMAPPVGMLEPVLVRQRADKAGAYYELIAGERRWRASGLAKLERIPCIVRDLSDDQVLEVMAIENNQRSDVHPLDEAELFAELVKHGRTQAQIAETIGRDGRYVAKRMALNQLCEKARKKYDAGRLTFGAALVIARVPSAKLQAEAVAELTRFGDMTVSEQRARQHVEARYMLRLAQAPWSKADDKLVPKAGACSQCPKRTGNQRELFDDIKSPDLCIDPACFRDKMDAVFKLRKAEGAPVLEGKEAKAELGAYDGKKYQRMDTERYISGHGHKKVSQIVKKAKPQVTLAQDPRTGHVVELVERAVVDKALREQRRDSPAAARGSTPDYMKRQREQQKLTAAVAERCLALGAAAAEKSTDHDALLRTLVIGLARRMYHDGQVRICKRRGIEVPETKRMYGGTHRDYEGALVKAIEAADMAAVRGFGWELTVTLYAPQNHMLAGEGWNKELQALGIDPKKVEAEVKAELKAKKKKAGKKKSSKPAAKGKRTTSTSKGKKPSTPPPLPKVTWTVGPDGKSKPVKKKTKKGAKKR